MSEKVTNIDSYRQKKLESQSRDLTERKPELRLTRRGKAAAWMAAAGLLSVSTLIAANGPESSPDDTPKLIPIPKVTGDTDSIGTFQGTEDWNSVVKVKVEPGDSISSIQLKVYGADDSEQPMNNEFYNDEISIIRSAQPDPEMLHPGDVLVLPTDVTQHYAIPEEESN